MHDPGLSGTTGATQLPGDPPRAPAFRWIPIRSLSERHRPRIVAHLVALDDADRYLRFGHPASDAQIGHYVDTIDFERDEVFGIFNRRLEVIALAHLAYLPEIQEQPPGAEFGVSVMSKARGRGYGSRLFDHAILHARNRGIDHLIVHALRENTAMLRIARSAGATIVREGPEAQANLELPADDISSHLGAMLESGAAEIDYRFKTHAQQFSHFIGALADVKAMMDKSRGQPAE